MAGDVYQGPPQPCPFCQQNQAENATLRQERDDLVRQNLMLQQSLNILHDHAAEVERAHGEVNEAGYPQSAGWGLRERIGGAVFHLREREAELVAALREAAEWGSLDLNYYIEGSDGDLLAQRVHTLLAKYPEG